MREILTEYTENYIELTKARNKKRDRIYQDEDKKCEEKRREYENCNEYKMVHEFEKSLNKKDLAKNLKELAMDRAVCPLPKK